MFNKGETVLAFGTRRRLGWFDAGWGSNRVGVSGLGEKDVVG